ncbi:prepilin-type N-terminal cleavage/methylation domain-containing protein [Deinococcus planocerae]|uniref:prepilin-type N-terminal cleavage/methylation domain-containing protein n=1 Tax=Deinococcus planocerae TaxID=1737569 RepID=UPI000C7F73FD|nr:prepilin-type N-terminal cleavage/methylation domain-containing protein [Deinococcus planocerae]
MSRRLRRSGFTLIELLVVLVILGVLMGLFGMGYLRSVRAGEVRQGAAQLAADLRAARSSAQRQSQSASFSWADGMTNLSTYTLSLPSGTSVRSLPNRVTFRCVSGGGCPAASSGVRTLTYLAPYGEMTSTINGMRLLVESTVPNIPALEVRVVGVTGRVMITAVSP